MPTAPLRQHWVPKTYLRAFRASPTSDDQILARDLNTGREFRTSLANVAVMRDLYTLNIESETPSYAVEAALGVMESAFSPLMSRITNAEDLELTEPERETFARFLAALHLRTRQGLAVIQSYRDEVASQLGTTSLSLPVGHAESLVQLDQNGLREFFARAVVSITPGIADALLRMSWRLVRATDAHFITSENPLVVHHSSAERWGIGTPGVHVQLPLTPRLLLHMSHEAVIPGRGTFDLPAEGVRGLNGLTLVAAEQYIFSSEPFDTIRSLIDERPIGQSREFGPKAKVTGRGRT